jgi:hypothetical protein
MGISRLPDHRLALAAIAPANHGAARAERSEPKVLEPQEFLSDRAGRGATIESNLHHVPPPGLVEVGDDAELVGDSDCPSTRQERRGSTGGGPVLPLRINKWARPGSRHERRTCGRRLPADPASALRRCADADRDARRPTKAGAARLRVGATGSPQKGERRTRCRRVSFDVVALAGGRGRSPPRQALCLLPDQRRRSHIRRPAVECSFLSSLAAIPGVARASQSLDRRPWEPKGRVARRKCEIAHARSDTRRVASASGRHC